MNGFVNGLIHNFYCRCCNFLAVKQGPTKHMSVTINRSQQGRKLAVLHQLCPITKQIVAWKLLRAMLQVSLHVVHAFLFQVRPA